VSELYEQFSFFEDDEVMSVASDLTPHYAHVLRHHRAEHPQSSAGEPGRFQVQ
jgi:hypothetical protein